MTFDCGRSKPEKARRGKFHPQAIRSFFAILTISSVMACTPPVPSSAAIDSTATQPPATRPIVLTETAGSTPIVEAPSASPLPPPATPTSKVPALGTSLVFVTDADARVRQSHPSENYGTGTTLRVDGQKDSLYESFLRFTVTGVSSTIQSARLRLYVTDNGTQNGPAVYATSNSWSEAEITWDNRPGPTSEAADNKESLGTNNWVEYDVTPLIGGEGIFSFVLVGDSNDGVHFSSRQGAQPPQLILTLGDTPAVPKRTRSWLVRAISLNAITTTMN
jgi:hypothetical protein